MRGDFSTIIGSFISFIVFLVSISVLYFLTKSFVNSIYDSFTSRVTLYEKMSKTQVEILNNQTSRVNPYITIKNVGRDSLDLSCFKVYIDGKFVEFAYSINELYKDGLLNPGETANVTVTGTFLSGWHLIKLVSCEGSSFESLIYFS